MVFLPIRTHDTAWLLDSGSSNHFTFRHDSNLPRMVDIDNGTQMPCLGSGHVSVSFCTANSSRPIVFTDILHTPFATVNLLSIKQFRLHGLGSCFGHDGIFRIIDVHGNLKRDAMNAVTYSNSSVAPRVTHWQYSASMSLAQYLLPSGFGTGTSVWTTFVVSTQWPTASALLLQTQLLMRLPASHACKALSNACLPGYLHRRGEPLYLIQTDVVDHLRLLPPAVIDTLSSLSATPLVFRAFTSSSRSRRSSTSFLFSIASVETPLGQVVRQCVAMVVASTAVVQTTDSFALICVWRNLTCTRDQLVYTP
jgi:hypothetical protein